MTNNKEKDEEIFGKKGYRINPIIRGKPPEEPKRKEKKKRKSNS